MKYLTLFSILLIIGAFEFGPSFADTTDNEIMSSSPSVVASNAPNNDGDSYPDGLTTISSSPSLAPSIVQTNDGDSNPDGVTPSETIDENKLSLSPTSYPSAHPTIYPSSNPTPSPSTTVPLGSATQNDEEEAANDSSGSFFSHFLFLGIGVVIGLTVMKRIRIRRRQHLIGRVQSMNHRHLDELSMDGEFI